MKMQKRIFFFLTTILLFAGCRMQDVSEDPDTRTDGAAVIRLAGTLSRTVNPDVSLADMTDFVLKGTPSGGTEQTLATWETYTSATVAEVTIKTGEWNFTLTAKQGGLSFCGSLSQTVVAGTNTLTFEMTLSSMNLTDGTGNLSLKLTVPSDVKAVVAGLFKTDGSAADGFSEETLSLTESAATYAKTGVPSGTYIVVFTMYGDAEKTVKLGTYRELSNISDGCTSRAERSVTELSGTNSISYELNGGQTDDALVPLVYSRFTESVELPTATRAGYFFLGWCQKEDLSDTPLMTISPNTVGADITLYAKWSDGSCTYDQIGLLYNSIPKGGTYTIKITDTIDTVKKWEAVCDALKDLRSVDGVPVYVNLEINVSCSELTTVNVPETVVGLSEGAFAGCANITEVTVPGSCRMQFVFPDCYKTIQKATVTGESICASAFSGCSGLTSVTISEGVTSIGDYAFYDCSGLTSVTIPEGVTSIGEQAFRDCSGLTSVTIPSTVTSIEDNAFFGCGSLKNVYISDIAAWMNIAFGPYDSNPIYFAENLYLNGNLLTELVVPDGVTNIGNYAFLGYSGLTSVTIPESVTSIGDRAFECCSGLKNVYISDLEAWMNIAFDSYFSNPMYYGENLYLNGTLLTELVIPDGVTNIRNYTFYGCSGLTSVTIPESVTSIGDYAFHDCSGLTSVTISEGVTSIGDWAFSGCSGLTSVTIPESVTSIGDRTFWYCRGLTSVTIASNVTSIGESAFYGCSGLTSVTIPESVMSISIYAFYGCSGLTSVTFEDSTSTWAVNGNTVSVSNASQNATYLTSTYYLHNWEKNTQ